jgi:hypothetical protein
MTYLFLGNLHVIFDTTEDGRLDEIAFVTDAFTTTLQLGTCFLA